MPLPRKWSQFNCMTLSWWPRHEMVSVTLHLHTYISSLQYMLLVDHLITRLQNVPLAVTEFINGRWCIHIQHMRSWNKCSRPYWGTSWIIYRFHWNSFSHNCMPDDYLLALIKPGLVENHPQIISTCSYISSRQHGKKRQDKLIIF